MGVLRSQQVHPDMQDVLDQILGALAGGATSPVVLNLTAGGRRRDLVRSCVCFLEELGNGKTKVHLITGKNTTVDEATTAVEALLAA